MNYKLLGKSGLRVSELCLGTMTFGPDWGWGADKVTSRAIYDIFRDRGGNFLDTANRYTEGTSESFLGEFIKETGDRNEVVLATKYSLFTENGKLNDGGNHRKNLVQSLEGSLKRLQTDYIDLLYLHAWDFMTPVEEVMRALDDLIRAGKVLYIGISDAPAWIVSRANTIAELRGWTQFVALQVEYSLITRDAEREYIPMAEELDLAIAAWAPLAGGALTGKYLSDNDEPKRLKEGSKRLNDKSRAITREVVAIAAELGCSPAQVAMNWVRQVSPTMIPVVGARKAGHIEDSLSCLDYTLTEAQLLRLHKVSEIELGFPHDFLASDGVLNVIHGGNQDKIHNHRKPSHRPF